MSLIGGNGVYFFELNQKDGKSSCMEIVNFSLIKNQIELKEKYKLCDINTIKIDSNSFMEFYTISNSDDILNEIVKYIIKYYELNEITFFECCIPYKHITKRNLAYPNHCNCKLKQEKNDSLNLKIYIKLSKKEEQEL